MLHFRVESATYYLNSGNLNEHSEEKNGLLYYAHSLIDKSFKEEILEELDFKYGINEKSLFVENEFLENVKDYYDDLYSEALIFYDKLKTEIRHSITVKGDF